MTDIPGKNMKSLISSLLFGLLVIASATSFTACQNAEKNTPQQEAAVPSANEAQTEQTQTEALSEKAEENAPRQETAAPSANEAQEEQTETETPSEKTADTGNATASEQDDEECQ